MAYSNKRLWFGLACIYLSLIPHILRIDDSPHGDVALYFRTVQTLLDGAIPYHLERPFEYPPYALVFFLVPSIGETLQDFRFIFSLQLLTFDFLFKWWLLNEGLRRFANWKAYVPLTAFSIGTGFLATLYLQRIDLFPALLTFFSIYLIGRGKPLWSGLVLGIGGGTKLFPILVFPLLIALGRNWTQRRKITAGIVISLVPIALVSPWVSWWRFLEFHNQRGFEVESTYAALFWLANYFVDLDLSWSWVIQWREVTGPDIVWLLPYAKAFCLVTTFLAASWISFVAWGRRATRCDLPEACSMALVVFLPFVAFNIVLSPQYMIWLVALASVGLLTLLGSTEPAFVKFRGTSAHILIVSASVLTQIWYPSPEFRTGFNVVQTCVLLLRNAMLVVSWFFLMASVSEIANPGVNELLFQRGRKR